jgi:hypothetical protein
MSKIHKITGTKLADILNGTDLADKIVGKGGADAIFGDAGNDKIKAGAGNDTISGGRGNDDIDGGKGIDTAVYQGLFAQYTLSFSHDGDLKGTVGDLVANRDGTDTLKNVEFLQFSDAIYDVANDTVYLLNHTPVFTSANTASVAENTKPVVTLAASDADNDAISFSITGGADALLFEIVSGNQLRFKATPDYETPGSAAHSNAYNVQVTASDGSATTLQSIVVNVIDRNDNAPAITSSDTFSVAENTTAVGTVTASDADTVGGPTQFSISGGADAALFSIDANSGALSFNAARDYETQPHSYHVQVKASDGSNFSTQNVTVNLANVNDNAPVITSGAAASEAENTATTNVVYQVTATDADNDAMAFSLSGDDALLFDIDASTGAVTFKASPDYETPADADLDNYYEITLHADDGAHDTIQAVTIEVTNLTGSIMLAGIAAGTGGFRIIGETVGDQVGVSVSGLGDLNGDGIADLLVGANASDAGGINSGAAYVVFGKADGSAVNLDNVALGSGGFKIVGEIAGDEAGRSVAGLGDVNGDGCADLLVGAMNNAGGLGSGAAYVVFGKTDGSAVNLDDVALGTGGFKIIGEAANDLAGASVAGLVDLNGDGRADLLVAANHNDAGGLNSGAVYVVFGKADGSAVNLDDVALGIGGFKIVAEAAGDMSGSVVGKPISDAGDVNGDGISDLLVGANSNDAGGLNSGAAYVVFGKADGSPVNLDDVALGIGGFKIIGEAAGNQVGDSVSGLGDVNGDGIPDLLIGAQISNAGGISSGAAYVVFGKADGSAINLDDVALGLGGFKIIGENAQDRAGISVSGLGDLNGDDIPDLLVGTRFNEGGDFQSGAAYVVFGKADGSAINLDDVALGTGGFKIAGEAGGDMAGLSVSGLGDLNGDGRTDLLVGAFGSDAGGFNSGAAYVVFSQPDWLLLH